MLLTDFMHRKSVYAVLLVLAMAFAATAAAQEQTLYDAWKAAEGQRGTLKQEEGGYVYSIDDEGTMVIAYVGRDYVDFARYTKAKGERLTHRLIPISRLVLRRSRLSP
jgi:hypothetical protein